MGDPLRLVVNRRPRSIITTPLVGPSNDGVVLIEGGRGMASPLQRFHHQVYGYRRVARFHLCHPRLAGVNSFSECRLAHFLFFAHSPDLVSQRQLRLDIGAAGDSKGVMLTISRMRLVCRSNFLGKPRGKGSVSNNADEWLDRAGAFSFDPAN